MATRMPFLVFEVMEDNFDFLFGHLDRIGYTGWVGCEYRPVAGTEVGLGWFERARAMSR